jgi:hypothetical protein
MPATPMVPVVPPSIMPMRIVDIRCHAMRQRRVINGRTVGLRSRSARGSEHEQACHCDGPEQNFAHFASHRITRSAQRARADRTETQRCRCVAWFDPAAQRKTPAGFGGPVGAIRSSRVHRRDGDTGSVHQDGKSTRGTSAHTGQRQTSTLGA